MTENNDLSSSFSSMAGVFRALPGLYILLSPELVIVDCTERYSRTTYFNIDDVIGRNILDTFPDNPDESNQKARHDLELSLQHVLKHKEPHVMPVLRFDVPLPPEQSGGFEERFWHTTNTPILDKEGEITYILHETRDITEKVRNERNVKRLDLLSSALHAVLWEYDNVHNRSYWGESIQKVFGYTPEEMTSSEKSWEVRVHPEDFPAIMSSIEQALSSGEKTWTGEYRFLRANKTYAYVLGQAHISYDKNGHPELTVGTMVDLSSRKRAEQDLRESNERFQKLIESLPLMAWTASPSGKILHFNRNWYSYTGMPQGQTEGWINMVHPEDSAQVLTAWRKAVVTGQLLEEEYRLRDYIDGSYRWFLERAVPIQDENGKVKLWIGTYTDIHEQKHVLEQLRVKDQFMENILKTSPAHLCLLSGPKHICQFVTPGVYHMYGSRQYIGKPASAIWPELEVFEFGKLLDQVYHEGVTVSINEFRTPIDRHQRGEPQDAYFNFKYQPLLDSDGNVEGVLISAIEVTELVSAKNKAEALAMELQNR
jgi:PAS domain S-box-containing protein